MLAVGGARQGEVHVAEAVGHLGVPGAVVLDLPQQGPARRGLLQAPRGQVLGGGPGAGAGQGDAVLGTGLAERDHAHVVQAAFGQGGPGPAELTAPGVGRHPECQVVLPVPAVVEMAGEVGQGEGGDVLQGEGAVTGVLHVRLRTQDRQPLAHRAHGGDAQASGLVGHVHPQGPQVRTASPLVILLVAGVVQSMCGGAVHMALARCTQPSAARGLDLDQRQGTVCEPGAQVRFAHGVGQCGGLAHRQQSHGFRGLVGEKQGQVVGAPAQVCDGHGGALRKKQ